MVTFPVPVMHMVEENTEAREEMRHQNILFSDETNVKLAPSTAASLICDVVQKQPCILLKNPFQLPEISFMAFSQTTRAMVFNQSTERRMAILEDLSLHGMNVTDPKNLSSQIDTQHAELERALLQNRDGVLISITSGLKLLNRQFRATVEGYQMSLQAQLKAEE